LRNHREEDVDLLPMPNETVNALQARGVSTRTIIAIQLIVTCLDQVCEWVAQDTGSDRRDDATSRGGLRWRRARNYVMEILDSGQVPELSGITADTTDNALQIPIDGTRLSFYAARNGIDHPDLSGGSKVKKVVVSEMQLSFEAVDSIAAPSRLVLMYDSDRNGLLSAAIGRLSSTREWAEEWRFKVFEREEEAGRSNEAPVKLPSYDEQPEPKLPRIEPIVPASEESDSEQGSTD